MIGLLQRVNRASVDIDGKQVAAIGCGLLVFIGVERCDSEAHSDRLLERVLAYRVFPDATGRMNRDVREIGGGLLLVPQFTLPADTHKGNRPSFTPAAPPEQGNHLFTYLYNQAKHAHADTQSGLFGAEMQVSLVNDGPVTFWLRVPADA
ncbi:MAG TPA: D-aminoacyl-tRNA deacylase [Gammaproteobacteria bacterium]|nr:D-aminoacyl-tRNA deacylase [Gammaproteobacteria bacterium]